MAWAQVIQAVVQGAGKTMDAFANKASNDSALSGLDSAHQYNLLSINRESASARATLAVRGIRQGINQIKNEENQKSHEAMMSKAIATKKLKDSTTMGFIDAALGTSADVAQGVNNIQQQRTQDQQTALFQQRLQQREYNISNRVDKLEIAAEGAESNG